MVWHERDGFGAGCVVLVLTDGLYDEQDCLRDYGYSGSNFRVGTICKLPSFRPTMPQTLRAHPGGYHMLIRWRRIAAQRSQGGVEGEARRPTLSPNGIKAHGLHSHFASHPGQAHFLPMPADRRTLFSSGKLDRHHLVREPLSAQGNDVAYWRAQTPGRRLAALEFMRQLIYRYDPDTARISRIHRPVKRPAR